MRSNSTARRSTDAASGSIVRRRKNALLDPVDPVAQAAVVRDPKAAAQAGVLPVVVTSVAVVTAGLPRVLHLRAIAKVEVRPQVLRDLAVLGPVAMPVRAQAFGETSAAMTGVVAIAIVVVVVVPPRTRARVAVAVAVVVVVAAAVKITTKSRRPAASSTTSTIGIRPLASRGSARRSADRRAFGVAGPPPSVSR